MWRQIHRPNWYSVSRKRKFRRLEFTVPVDERLFQNEIDIQDYSINDVQEVENLLLDHQTLTDEIVTIKSSIINNLTFNRESVLTSKYIFD